MRDHESVEYLAPLELLNGFLAVLPQPMIGVMLTQFPSHKSRGSSKNRKIKLATARDNLSPSLAKSPAPSQDHQSSLFDFGEFLLRLTAATEIERPSGRRLPAGQDCDFAKFSFVLSLLKRKDKPNRTLVRSLFWTDLMFFPISALS